MTLLEAKNLNATGQPLYEMRKLFEMKGIKAANMSIITILPGSRVPEKGAGCHEGDEYSYFLEGEVYTESGENKGVVGKGMATLIPKGEWHWCENRTDKPCTLVCVMTE